MVEPQSASATENFEDYRHYIVKAGPKTTEATKDALRQIKQLAKVHTLEQYVEAIAGGRTIEPFSFTGTAYTKADEVVPSSALLGRRGGHHRRYGKITIGRHYQRDPSDDPSCPTNPHVHVGFKRSHNKAYGIGAISDVLAEQGVIVIAQDKRLRCAHTLQQYLATGGREKLFAEMDRPIGSRQQKIRRVQSMLQRQQREGDGGEAQSEGGDDDGDRVRTETPGLHRMDSEDGSTAALSDSEDNAGPCRRARKRKLRTETVAVAPRYNFIEMVRLLQRANCQTVGGFTAWLIGENRPEAEWIGRRDFDQLANKAITGVRQLGLNSTWREELENYAVKNCVFNDAKTYHTIPDSVSWLFRLLYHNKICPAQFTQQCRQIMDKELPKINCLWLKGSKNCGKSVIGKMWKESVRYGCTTTKLDGEKSNFALCGLINKRCALMDEVRITGGAYEEMLMAMAGEPTEIEMKNRNEREVLHRTPMFFCTNNELGAYIDPSGKSVPPNEVLRARCISYHVTPYDELANKTKMLHPGAWLTMLDMLEYWTENDGYWVDTVHTDHTGVPFVFDFWAGLTRPHDDRQTKAGIYYVRNNNPDLQ